MLFSLRPLRSYTHLMAALVVVSVLSASVTYYFLTKKPEIDAPMTAVLQKVSEADVYTQFVETEFVVGMRHFAIKGTYRNNSTEGRYESVSTTTLMFLDSPSEPLHSFTLHNISVGNEIYTKLETESELLKKTVPLSKEWQRFTRGAVPDAFADIAVSGPVLDNIRILDKEGMYLALTESPYDETWGEETLRRYHFVLSDAAEAKVGGTLETLFARVGDGSVDVWIDAQAGEVRYIRFENPPYYSTTTLSFGNSLPAIAAPSMDVAE